VNVQFTVSGSVNETDVDTTDGNGEARFCYQGPPLPGADTVTAIADADDDGMFEVGEPSDTATKAWILPVTPPGCEITITNGGWIIANNGDRGSFGGNAKSDGEGNVSGQEQYQDHGPVEPFNLHGMPTVIVCYLNIPRIPRPSAPNSPCTAFCTCCLRLPAWTVHRRDGMSSPSLKCSM